MHKLISTVSIGGKKDVFTLGWYLFSSFDVSLFPRFFCRLDHPLLNGCCFHRACLLQPQLLQELALIYFKTDSIVPKQKRRAHACRCLGSSTCHPKKAYTSTRPRYLQEPTLATVSSCEGDIAETQLRLFVSAERLTTEKATDKHPSMLVPVITVAALRRARFLQIISDDTCVHHSLSNWTVSSYCPRICLSTRQMTDLQFLQCIGKRHLFNFVHVIWKFQTHAVIDIVLLFWRRFAIKMISILITQCTQDMHTPFLFFPF